MSAPNQQRYRRSWKNLLLNKRYQLRFTLFMVAVSAVLMAMLGWWVMTEAEKTTTVSINNVLGHECPDPPVVMTLGSGDTRLMIDDITGLGPLAPAAGDSEAPTGPDDVGDLDDADGLDDLGDLGDLDDDGDLGDLGDLEESLAALAGDAAEDERARSRPQVVISDTTMEDIAARQAVPPDYVERVVAAYECRLQQVAKIASLRRGQDQILWVLIAVGVLLVFGLTLYGIKMTHRVAGPLFKVTLYFDKLRDGTYDRVYDLRKGDQLVEFYEQFKAAHRGLRDMEEQDIARLRQVIEAADAAKLAERSPEVAAALEELRAVLARKEESLG
jgi:hypothetical protein